jgi:transposase
VETNATCMCARLVGLPDVTVLAVDDRLGDPIRVHVEQRVDRSRCEECGTAAWVKDRPVVELADLPCFGRSARLVWHKHRWCCRRGRAQSGRGPAKTLGSPLPAWGSAIVRDGGQPASSTASAAP